MVRLRATGPDRGLSRMARLNASSSLSASPENAPSSAPASRAPMMRISSS